MSVPLTPPKVDGELPENITLPQPKPLEKRGEFVKRCCGGAKIGEYSKWADPNRIIVDCLAEWGKAKVNAAAVVGSGDSEVIIPVVNMDQQKEAGTPVSEAPIDQTPTYTQKKTPNLELSSEANGAVEQDKTAPELFATLLNSATVAHILHLQADTYSKHKALNKLYDELPELTDDMIEAYQGKYGIVSNYPAQSVTTPSDCIEFAQGLRKFVADNRYVALSSQDTELQNITDNIVELLDSTIYKLTFLK